MKSVVKHNGPSIERTFVSSIIVLKRNVVAFIYLELNFVAHSGGERDRYSIAIEREREREYRSSLVCSNTFSIQ